jgi:large subunit ribosomal protein L25
MKTLELKGEIRTATGKKAAADLRRSELIPCVLYGGEAPVHFTVPERELRHLVYTPKVFFVEVQVDGHSYQSVMKDSQFDPVSDALLHLDFLLVDATKPIRMDIPVRVVGNSPGVRNGGKLVVNVRKLKVSAMANDMPDEIDLDISNLNIGDSLRIGHLKVDGVEFLEASNIVVAAVRMTRNARSAQAAADGKK